ncbi:DifB protein [[Actinomadura] parvosata subsp. kistnae]|uniref:dGTPase n=2 Tax=Nonomuraea TaxID=83681 RepID=A0A1V0AD05_9ACTN|nr:MULTISPECIES: MmcQ/YjbR family DNA-binding protein [unclassified Nonomuraea]AQZ68075.1 dGTPase [Nonomuraea sp. ATCC 55076]NJP96217.1 MmcQ/YjbR family DNA-binding protein [Nonomuraea sp. FMUSA5-5]SPL93544.1 DifB protein [Actinomadura parvosata subsp. kistnae]
MSDDWHDVREELRTFALGLPETREDHPWGETVIKVGKKVFLFLGIDERTEKWEPSFGVKLLSEAHGHALTVEGARPSGYGLGKAGWVTVPFLAELPETEVLLDWVEESYRTIAPKRAVKELDLR